MLVTERESFRTPNRTLKQLFVATVIQLVGRDPQAMADGARLAAAAGADIVDLNFGCPAREVTGGD